MNLLCPCKISTVRVDTPIPDQDLIGNLKGAITAHINHPPSKPWPTAAARQNLPETEEFWRRRAAWSFSTARFPRSH